MVFLKEKEDHLKAKILLFMHGELKHKDTKIVIENGVIYLILSADRHVIFNIFDS